MTGSIKLKSTSGGSTTIIAPTTASDYTLTVPTTTGNVVVADTGGNVYITGTANAVSHTTGATGTGTGGLIANVTTVFIGNNTANAVLTMPATLLPQLTIANSGGTTLITPAAVNAASHTVGSSFIANTTGAYHTGVINAASHTTTGVTANVTGVYPASNSSGTALGTTTNRWVITANSLVLTTALALADGGTGASTAANARTNLGFTGAIVAWANMNGKSTPALNASGNISSITDNGVGDYTLNLTSATTDGNYALCYMGVAATGTNVTGATLCGLYPTGTTTFLPATKSTTAMRFIVGDTTGTLYDSGNISIIFIR